MCAVQATEQKNDEKVDKRGLGLGLGLLTSNL